MRKQTKKEEDLREDAGEKLGIVLKQQNKITKVSETIISCGVNDNLMIKLIEGQHKHIDYLYNLCIASSKLKDYLTKKLDKLEDKTEPLKVRVR